MLADYRADVVAAFSQTVTSPQWRAAAEAWISRRLAARGVSVVGPIEQPRVRPWSTQLTVPTDAGEVWFKANCPPMAFEGALQRAIHGLAPEAVQEPIAVAPEYGWMLTADHGPSLGETGSPTAAEWAALLAEAGSLQRRLRTAGTELRATGMPDCSPRTVPARFEALRRQLRAYPPTHPGHLSADDDAQLERARPALSAAAARLTESPWPASWNHGDLHPWNAYRDNGRIRLFDLGDGQWAHALELLAVPYDWIEQQDGLDWADLLGGYLDAWGIETVTEEDWRDMRVVRAVNRALTWAAWLDLTSADELAQYGGEPEEHLLSVLDELGERERPRTLYASGA